MVYSIYLFLCVIVSKCFFPNPPSSKPWNFIMQFCKVWRFLEMYVTRHSRVEYNRRISRIENLERNWFYPLCLQFICSDVSDSLQPSPTPGVHPNPCSLSRWCHTTISSSVIPFSSCPQSFPASRSFQMSQLIASGGQSIGVSASTSVLPMNTQDWSPLGWTGWISLQSKGLSRVFSNTAVQKHQFFCPQLSSQSNSHIHTWLLEKS